MSYTIANLDTRYLRASRLWPARSCWISAINRTLDDNRAKIRVDARSMEQDQREVLPGDERKSDVVEGVGYKMRRELELGLKPPRPRTNSRQK